MYTTNKIKSIFNTVIEILSLVWKKYSYTTQYELQNQNKEAGPIEITTANQLISERKKTEYLVNRIMLNLLQR